MTEDKMTPATTSSSEAPEEKEGWWGRLVTAVHTAALMPLIVLTIFLFWRGPHLPPPWEDLLDGTVKALLFLNALMLFLSLIRIRIRREPNTRTVDVQVGEEQPVDERDGRIRMQARADTWGYLIEFVLPVTFLASVAIDDLDQVSITVGILWFFAWLAARVRTRQLRREM